MRGKNRNLPGASHFSSAQKLCLGWEHYLFLNWLCLLDSLVGWWCGSRPSRRDSRGTIGRPCGAPGTGNGWRSKRLAAFERDEVSEGVGQLWSEGLERERFRDVEAGGFGGSDVHKRSERSNGLFNFGPAESALVAVVVGRCDAFGDTLCAGDRRDGAAILRGNVRAEDAGESSVIAFNAHDAGGGHAEASAAEIADADQVRGDEGVFESDKRVESGFGAEEHVFRIEERSKWRRLVRDGLFESVVGHFFLESTEEIALIVVGKSAKKRCGADDVRIGGDGQSFGDFRGDEDFDVFMAQFFVVIAIIVMIVVAGSQVACCGFCGGYIEEAG